MRPKYYERSESSGCHEHVSLPVLKWDVDCFQKNGGSLFTRSTNREATLVWFNDTEVVLEQIGCPLDL